LGNAAPCPHEKENRFSEMKKVFFIDHPLGFPCQRNVKAEYISLADNFLHRYFRRIAVRKACLILVVSDDVDIKSRQLLGHRLPVVSVPYQSNRTTFQFITAVFLSMPCPPAYLLMSAIKVVHQTKEHTDHMFSDGITVSFVRC